MGLNPFIVNVLDLFLWQFLYPLTLFLFFYKISNPSSEKQQNFRYLYIPFLFLSILNCIISFSNTFHLYNLPSSIKNYIPLFYRLVSFLSMIFPVYTTVISYQFITTHKDDASKKWLHYLWIFLSLILLFGVVLESYRFVYSEKLPLTYLWTFSSIFLYWLVYKGMYQFKLSNDRYEIRIVSKKAPRKSPTTENSKNVHFKKLLLLIEEENIHHNLSLIHI